MGNSQIWHKWEDKKLTIEHLRGKVKEVEKGIKSFSELGCDLFIIRPMKQYGKWGEFLDSIGLSSTKDLNCRLFAQVFMIEAGIISEGEYPEKKYCDKALELLASNSAFMQKCLDSIDVKGIRRQKTKAPRVITGTIIDLEPNYSQLISKTKDLLQKTKKSNKRQPSAEMLQRVITELSAIVDNLNNEPDYINAEYEVKDTECNGRRRELTIASKG